MVRGAPYLMPIHLKGQAGQFLVVFNGNPDAARPVVQMFSADTKPAESTLLAPLKKPVRAPVDSVVDRVTEGKTVTVTSRDELPYRGFLALQW